jgi:2-polyprenyl-3-methyl-5-hydroxy-6-metoxy-1,4-benzoquinol methylase
MSNHLQKIADWIGATEYAGKHVVEVGAGGGYLARILSQRARSVTVFEPSAGLQAEMLPEANISLIKEMFTASLVEGRADLVVCRHVLEHVADPLSLVRDMGGVLEDGGTFVS